MPDSWHERERRVPAEVRQFLHGLFGVKEQPDSRSIIVAPPVAPDQVMRIDTDARKHEGRLPR